MWHRKICNLNLGPLNFQAQQKGQQYLANAIFTPVQKSCVRILISS
ncbi:hypothetical protein PLUTE_a0940 [Pseudoalteromonas luteoviolacea DSM 6061]|nr:hypothetical protein [Pseudoalteromonas luteoviolacea DSM 6061]